MAAPYRACAGSARRLRRSNPFTLHQGATEVNPLWGHMNAALTILSEDEQLFRDSCRSFAEGRIRPLVRKMDEEAKLDHSVIPELFQLGLMGIHIPEEFGGGSGSFFMSVLAVEEIFRVDASFCVFIYVQNTLVNN